MRLKRYLLEVILDISFFENVRTKEESPYPTPHLKKGEEKFRYRTKSECIVIEAKNLSDAQRISAIHIKKLLTEENKGVVDYFLYILTKSQRIPIPSKIVTDLIAKR